MASKKPPIHGPDHGFALNAAGELVSAGADPIPGIANVRDSYLSSAVGTLNGGGSPYSSDGAYPVAQTLPYIFVKQTSGSGGAAIAQTSSTELTLQQGIYQAWLTLFLDQEPLVETSPGSGIFVPTEFDGQIYIGSAGTHVRGYNIGALDNVNSGFTGYASGSGIINVGSMAGGASQSWQLNAMAWIQIPEGETATATVKTLTTTAGIGLRSGSNLSIIRLGGVNPVSDPTGLG